jgi:hypothetical protein
MELVVIFFHFHGSANNENVGNDIKIDSRPWNVSLYPSKSEKGSGKNIFGFFPNWKLKEQI